MLIVGGVRPAQVLDADRRELQRSTVVVHWRQRECCCNPYSDKRAGGLVRDGAKIAAAVTA